MTGISAVLLGGGRVRLGPQSPWTVVRVVLLMTGISAALLRGGGVRLGPQSPWTVVRAVLLIRTCKPRFYVIDGISTMKIPPCSKTIRAELL